MLYLFSISVTLVGTAILLALILFSHRNDDQEGAEGCESGDWEPLWESLPPSRAKGDAFKEEPPLGGDHREAGLPSEAPSGREGEAESPGKRAHLGTDGASAGTRTSVPGSSAIEPAVSIPILRPETVIPGLGNFELVHFLGNAGFGTLEDQREIEEVQIEGDGPRLELQGEIAITSKGIIVFDENTSKKIPFGIIETYRFHDSFLLIKKKNVKKKKTLLKIFGNVGDFQYILGVLIPL
jgi:hypothetical protein